MAMKVRGREDGEKERRQKGHTRTVDVALVMCWISHTHAHAWHNARYRPVW